MFGVFLWPPLVRTSLSGLLDYDERVSGLEDEKRCAVPRVSTNRSLELVNRYI